MKSSRKKFLLVMITAMITTQCATSRAAAFEKTYYPPDPKLSKLPADLEKLWASRHVKADLAKFLEETEKWVNDNPGSYEAKVRLCRGYYIMADGHLYLEMNEENESAIKKQQTANFDKGVRWCERGLSMNEAFFNAVVKGGGKPDDNLDKVSVAEIDALYWRYANLGKWSRLEGLMTLLENKSKFTAMMNRVEQLNPDYFHAAVLRYRAASEALSPTGSKKKADENFEACIAKAPNYFGTRVLYADFRLRGDEEKAKKQLNYVISGNPKALPDVESENIIEQMKAKKLLPEFE